MKIRQGFISNSSSSSFIIYAKYLSPYQREEMYNYVENNYSSRESYEEDNAHCYWSISKQIDDKDEVYYEFSTGMDNFNMVEYLGKLGATKNIEWTE
jgi:hypothetical protein